MRLRYTAPAMARRPLALARSRPDRSEPAARAARCARSCSAAARPPAAWASSSRWRCGIGLIQNTLQAALRASRRSCCSPPTTAWPSTASAPPARSHHAEHGGRLLAVQLPLSVFARIQGLELSVVDCRRGRAPCRRTSACWCARSRTARATRASTAAMSRRAGPCRHPRRHGDRRHAARQRASRCAGIGVGAHESAALVLSRLADAPVRELLHRGPAHGPERPRRTCWR
ncbi:MAG: hypothetical protein MZW92_23620 [Comamonadaceae bacterium]|nr:hypothetical protein [Comamonadaceae bacterium]